MSAAIRAAPHNPALERSVLASMLLDRELCAIAFDMLRAEHFHAPVRRAVFAAIRAEQDPVLVRGRLATDADALAEFDDHVGASYAAVLASSQIEGRCQELRDLAAYRELLRACASVAADGYELGGTQPGPALDAAAANLVRAIATRTGKSQCITVEDAMLDVLAALDQPDEVGVSTGLTVLDQQLGGLKPGKVYVVAGRPGMGKSTLGMQFAESAAKAGKRALIISLEMSARELALRMLSGRALLSTQQIADGRRDDLKMRRLANHAAVAAKLPLSFAQGVSQIEEIRRLVRSEHARSPLGLVVIDYLQLITTSERRDNREQQVSHISREIKLMAMEFGVPVVSMSQLNRMAEARGDKRPSLADLRESGAIEQDADAVLLLYREGYYDTEADQRAAEIIIAKHRGGPTGFARCDFVGELTRFVDSVRRWDGACEREDQ